MPEISAFKKKKKKKSQQKNPQTNQQALRHSTRVENFSWKS